MQIKNKYSNISNLITTLYNEKDKKVSRNKAIELANEILMLLGTPKDKIKQPSEILDRAFSSSDFRNQKMETWFERHPYLGGARVALKLFDDNDSVYESNFYQLTKSATKARIAATVMLTPNWEDSKLTMLPNYKVGVDFFLTHDSESLLLVLSKEGNLRVLELNERLTNTQITIFENLEDVFTFDGIDKTTGKLIKFEPQRTIHKKLWDSFELREVNNKFYNGVADHFEELVQFMNRNKELMSKLGNDKKKIQHFTNRLIGRILFLWFLKKKRMIDESAEYFIVGELKSTEYYKTKLKVLFFEVLNKKPMDRKNGDKITPYLNGGLFEIHEEDLYGYNLDFPEEWFNSFYDHLNLFNFTTDESTPEYQQIAIDPEMLGRVFENLLATIVPETSKTARDNKGAFYTPREIVSFMCKETLKYHLKNEIEIEKYFPNVDFLIDANDAEFEQRKSTGNANLWGEQSKEIDEQVINVLSNIKVLDPAVGSGAFSMGMLQLILRTLQRLKAVYDIETKTHIPATAQNRVMDLYLSKLGIIQSSIFGIDIEPMAIEIARLRIWLSLIVEDKKEIVEPLPNLDFNFVVSNSLLSLKTNKIDNIEILDIFGEMPENIELKDRYKNLRERYFDAHDLENKLKLRTEFDVLLKEMATKSNTGDELKKLSSWNPFNSAVTSTFFDSEIMFNVEKFDIIIGNPPYIGEKGNRQIFDDVKKTPFGNKYYAKNMDYFYYFFHMGIDHLIEGGILGFITTNYFTTADGGFKLRKDFYQRTNVLKLINLNEIVIFQSARGQHDMITFLKKEKQATQLTKQINVNVRGVLDSYELESVLNGSSDLINVNELNKDQLFTNIDEELYYIRFSSAERIIDEILSKMYAIKPKLGEITTVNQGLISGADTFSNSHSNKFPEIKADKGEGIFIYGKGELKDKGLQDQLIKPFFKNSDIDKWTTNDVNSLELFYYTGEEEPDPKFIKHLNKFHPLLSSRQEFVDGRRKWYSLHRTRDELIFKGPKIVVPQRKRTNSFAYNDIEWYTSADVYFITEKTNKLFMPFYLLGILNSKLVYTWLYFRGKRKGEMLEMYYTPLTEIPIKIGTKEQIRKLTVLSNKLATDKDISDAEKKKVEFIINRIVYEIYDLNEEEKTAINDFYDKKHKNIN